MPRAWIVRNIETDSIMAAFASLDEAAAYAKAENTRFQTDAWRAQAGKFDALPSTQEGTK